MQYVCAVFLFGARAKSMPCHYSKKRDLRALKDNKKGKITFC